MGPHFDAVFNSTRIPFKMGSIFNGILINGSKNTPFLTKMGQKSGFFGLQTPFLAKNGPILAKIDPKSGVSTRFGGILTQNGPILAPKPPKMVNFDHFGGNLAHFGPILAKIDPFWVENGQKWTKIAQNRGFWTQNRSKMGPFWPPI